MPREVFVNATILDCTGGDPFVGIVIVEDGRITEVQKTSHSAKTLSADDSVYDCRGITICPGLIDMHFHLVFKDVLHAQWDLDLTKSIVQATVDSVTNAAAVLAMGFTTVRDVGSRGNIAVIMRDAVASGLLKGPRIFAASRIISTLGGLGDQYPNHLLDPSTYRDSLHALITGPWEGRAAVRRQFKEQVDWIKVALSGSGSSPICPADRDPMSEEEFTAIVNEANRQGRPVAAHAEAERAVTLAAQVGVQTIEHGIFATDDAVEAMLKNRVTLIPTLGCYKAFAERGAQVGHSPEVIKAHSRNHSHHVASVKKAYEAGVRIAAGGDAGGVHFPQGSCTEEVDLYVRLIGMSPLEAMCSITRNGAQTLGIADQVGTIESGKVADFLLLSTNPADDIACLQRPTTVLAVFKKGELVAGSTQSISVRNRSSVN